MGVTLPTLVTVAPTVNRLLELLVQVWLAPSFTALFKATVPEAALMSMPLAPMLRAVPLSVRGAVAVVPSPTMSPVMLVVP